MFEFTCSICGEVHAGAPAFAIDLPADALFLTPSERDERVEASPELCIIRPDDHDPEGEALYFIRATLALPIQGSRRPFMWTLWVAQTEECFYDHAETLGESRAGVTATGMLSVALPLYDDSAGDEPLAELPCTVAWWAAGKRPVITLGDGDHPLIVDQQEGMSEERAVALSEIMLHG
jgi:hypothetical protein